jgi:hypothetical protein
MDPIHPQSREVRSSDESRGTFLPQEDGVPRSAEATPRRTVPRARRASRSLGALAIWWGVPILLAMILVMAYFLSPSLHSDLERRTDAASDRSEQSDRP